ncbi:hypothetical protein KAR91_73750 [Candidatus Pacearchaeota archaeon]|nr:hypothetical protein [Candidatus Pacearchaeota archaeon]
MKTTRHDVLYPPARQPKWGRGEPFARPTDLEDAGYGISADPDSEEHNYLFQGNSDWNKYNEENTRQIQPDVVVGNKAEARVTHDQTDFVAASLAGYRLLFVSGIVHTAVRTLANQVNVEMDTPDTSINIDTFDFTLVEVSGSIGITTNGGKLILNGVTHSLKVRGSVTVEEGPNFSGSYYLNGVLHSGAQDIQFLSQPDMVIMTSAELDNYSDDPKFVKYNFTTKLFETREGSARVPVTGDWSIIKSIETMTDDLEFPSTYNRPKIETDRHFQIPGGDAGGGYPYPIYVRGSGGICEFITDKTFAQLILLQAGTLPTAGELKSQQYIKNRGESNKILVNNRQIYSGDRPTEIQSSIQFVHPYAFSHNGFSFEGIAVSGVNDDETLLIDPWKFYGGIDLLGDGTILIAPINNPFASIALARKLFMPDDAGYFMRPATPFGGTGGVDPDIHDRTSPNGSETLTSGNYTSSAESIIKGISDANIKKFKVLARVYDVGLGIPGPNSGTQKTTIISKIVQNAADDNWIYLIDSETGSAVSVTATGDLTIDMGGNSGISLQDFAIENIIGTIQIRRFDVSDQTIVGETGAFSEIAGASSTPNIEASVNSIARQVIEFNASNVVNTSTETRPTSKQSYNYTLP